MGGRDLPRLNRRPAAAAISVAIWSAAVSGHLGHAVQGMPVEQGEGDLVEGGLDGDLSEYVDAGGRRPQARVCGYLRRSGHRLNGTFDTG